MKYIVPLLEEVYFRNVLRFEDKGIEATYFSIAASIELWVTG